jgi:hypothetical protein
LIGIGFFGRGGGFRIAFSEISKPSGKIAELKNFVAFFVLDLIKFRLKLLIIFISQK